MKIGKSTKWLFTRLKAFQLILLMKLIVKFKIVLAHAEQCSSFCFS